MKFIKGKPIPSWSNHHGHRGHQQKGIRPDSASAEDQMLARGWRSTCGLHQYGDGLKLGLSTALCEISHCVETEGPTFSLLKAHHKDIGTMLNGQWVFEQLNMVRRNEVGILVHKDNN